MDNPSYYAIIPANVRYDNTLKSNAKLMYGEITSLANKKGFCKARNEYFADLYEVHKDTVSEWINSLKNKGYITVEIYKKGKRVTERRIYPLNKIPVGENTDWGVGKNTDIPVGENTEENNTSINNNIYSRVVDYLNKKTFKNYKSTTKKTRSLIQARLNEKFTLEDFKSVIDIKSEEWKKDKQMNKYLRPETLFGNKFESYLNQRQKTISEGNMKRSDLKEVDFASDEEYTNKLLDN